jgi:hypothetical protein
MEEAPAVAVPARPAAARRPAAPARPAVRIQAPAARRATGGRSAVAALHHPQGLRRAVVLMTILGPCRAAAPHE